MTELLNKLAEAVILVKPDTVVWKICTNIASKTIKDYYQRQSLKNQQIKRKKNEERQWCASIQEKLVIDKSPPKEYRKVSNNARRDRGHKTSYGF